MTKLKRIMLTLCTIVGITLASVIGFACFAPKTSIRGGALITA